MRRLFALSVLLALALLASLNCGGSGADPLGKYAYVLSNPISIRKVHLSTGLQVGSTVALNGNLRNIAIHQGTGQMFGMGTDMNLYSVNVSTGTCTLISAAPMSLSSHNGGMTFLPNSNTLLFINQDSNRYRIDATTGAVTSTDLDTSIGIFGLARRYSDGWTFAYGAGDFVLSCADIDADPTFFTLGPPSVDLSGGAGMAIDQSDGKAYVVASEGLFRANLTNGALTPISFDGGDDIAVIP
ncbi:MAG: DUF4394 domain-containing protein [Chlorobia bacterium]|nr:DUF4394 domain-containing protein [Fimbriimonadaceae bacterium]